MFVSFLCGACIFSVKSEKGVISENQNMHHDIAIYQCLS